MKKIILLIMILTFVIIIGCSKESVVQDRIYELPNIEEIYFCETDAECGHLAGCNEKGGSPCVNIDYVKTYGKEKKNCDPDDVSFCYNCKCIDNKCNTVIDNTKYGC
jgi:hypothetical protein